MPSKKYTIDELDKNFDEELSSFKCDLVSDLKKEIVNEVKAILIEKDKEIEVLKPNHVNTVKHAPDKKVDVLEHYGRKVCLCIESVEHKVNEKSEDVLEKVINIIKQSEAEIPGSVLDRAYQIGPTYTDNDAGKKMQSIIVRLTAFRHRTLF